MNVTLVGKPGCHLCDEARVIVAQVCAETGSTFNELSVLDDEALFDAYWEKIPVLLIDGAVHDLWRVDPERLRAALSR
ncbi:MAG: glutaredoxin family protein [Candidatus Nanopelagicales bacterium]|nr:glutaredoxin family protein [Candidatus Nanopelagicales bacterium]